MHRIERRVASDRASIAPTTRRCGSLADALEQRLDQPRLAHAGFAGKQDGLPLAVLRQVPAVEQQAHFLRRGRRTPRGSRVRAAAKRLATHASRKTRQTGTGLSKPLSAWSPRLS